MSGLFAGVPEDEEIDFLYSLIRQDPDFFQAFDRTQFADTPLHQAASQGRTQLALEIQRLMPSFGRKLNPDGFSPLDLAMRWSHVETVIAMIKLNPELVRVQGREGFTPLHYAAETDDVDMLAEFLLSCPDSIEELTIRGETAVHVAVKNGKLAAFKVFYGWLSRTDRTEVLRWRDLAGNTVLHLAASTNQPKVMKVLVRGHINMNTFYGKNLRGLTAFDIIMQLPPQVNTGEALKMLYIKRATCGSCAKPPPKIISITLAKYLGTRMSILEKLLKFDTYIEKRLSVETRNTVLVVAVLIVTAMYQGMLTPPSKINLDPYSNSSLTTNITSYNYDTEVDDAAFLTSFQSFTTLNTVAFASGVGAIMLVLPLNMIFLTISLLPVMFSYLFILEISFPPDFLISGFDNNQIYLAIMWIIFLLIVVAKVIASCLKTGKLVPRQITGSNKIYNLYEVREQLFSSKYSGKRTT